VSCRYAAQGSGRHTRLKTIYRPINLCLEVRDRSRKNCWEPLWEGEAFSHAAERVLTQRSQQVSVFSSWITSYTRRPEDPITSFVSQRHRGTASRCPGARECSLPQAPRRRAPRPLRSALERLWQRCRRAMYAAEWGSRPSTAGPKRFRIQPANPCEPKPLILTLKFRFSSHIPTRSAATSAAEMCFTNNDPFRIEIAIRGLSRAARTGAKTKPRLVVPTHAARSAGISPRSGIR
jgi:hypothetical protein